MPLPFILGAAAVVVGAFGVDQALEAKRHNEEAESIQRKARRIAREAEENTNEARESTSYALKSLGTERLDISEGVLNDSLEILSKVKHVEKSELDILDESYDSVEEVMSDIKSTVDVAMDFSQGLAEGAIAGGALGFGAYGAVGYLGVASTGAAISGLSGAAATNATLAWFGGGSLAAGGLGMAGGSVVLGGIIAAPILAVAGSIFNDKSLENLEEAEENLAKAEKFDEEMITARQMMRAIRERAEMFENVLIRFKGILEDLTSDMAEVVEETGTDYREYSNTEKETFAKVVSTAVAITSLIKVPILTEDGELNRESRDVLLAAEDML